jgi:predicted alpha/beta-hydrolase family hydrolase
MRERAITFGPANLVGILTEPSEERALRDAPAVIILNSGILHRAGASRLYVQIARALAEDGLTCLRFDFSGIGDSEVRRDSIPIEERFTLEAREAMDYVETVAGIGTFIVGGLCSGADGAFWTGLADERVVGVWQIDAFCYRTLGYRVRRYAPKLLSPKAWLNSIRVRLPGTPDPFARDDDRVAG